MRCVALLLAAFLAIANHGPARSVPASHSEAGVVGDGLRLSIAGVSVGLLISTGLGLALSKVLYGVASVDVGVFAAVTVLLLTVSVLACYLPARMATRVDPLIALRHE